MSTFIFKSISGEVFTVKGPDGMTQDQAEAIWRQQQDTGALNGLEIGATVSAATQAAGGLTAAFPQLNQALAAASNLLPSGVNLGSIAAGLGPAALAAKNQIGSALAGTNPAIASNITGSSAGINGLVTGSGLSAVTGAVTGIAAQAGSIANRAISTLTGAVRGTPTDGINIADLARQAPAVGSIAGLNLNQVTGTLAQASKLVGQTADQISNSLGLGKFGFDATQLERGGYIKPGTAAEYLTQDQNSLTSVLKSPTVWTGKEGVKGIGDMLGNSKLQDTLQQGLMSSGLKDLKQLGIPVDKLNPAALSGLATNAAKSVTDAAKWVTGGAGLSTGVKSLMDSVASNSAFSIGFTDNKAEESVLKERVVEPAENTINDQTVSAAATRIVGNAKVPDVLAQ